MRTEYRMISGKEGLTGERLPQTRGGGHKVSAD